jgi:hypothetical protein
MDKTIIILIVVLVCGVTAAVLWNAYRMYYPSMDDSEEEDLPYIPRHVVTRVDPDAGRISPLPFPRSEPAEFLNPRPYREGFHF